MSKHPAVHTEEEKRLGRLCLHCPTAGQGHGVSLSVDEARRLRSDERRRLEVEAAIAVFLSGAYLKIERMDGTALLLLFSHFGKTGSTR